MAINFDATDTPKLKKMRDRWAWADASQAKQIKREQHDIAFEDDKQWPTDIAKTMDAQPPGEGPNALPGTPAQPMLVINGLKEPVRQILNAERQSEIGIELTPAEDFGDLGITPDETEIELREGLIRKIQRDSQAALARSWAYKRAVIAGRGYYMVLTRYLPGRTSDQEVYVHRIYNQEGVMLDPAHQMPDGSDCDWQFVGTWQPWDRFLSEHPEIEGHPNMLADCSDDDFMGMSEKYPAWYRSDTNGEKAVRIVNYFYTERAHRKIATVADGRTFWAEKPAADTPQEELAFYLPDVVKTDDGRSYVVLAGQPLEVIDERGIIEPVIKQCKVAGGFLILEETTHPGPDMPVVKVIGDEVLPYDEERRYNGIVRPAISPAQGRNYMVSKLVRTIGLTPVPPLVVDPEAIDGYEHWFAVANTRALPFLPSRTYDDQGRQLQEPHRPNVDPNIAPMAQATQMFSEMIKSTTAVPDATLGNVDPALKSGRAIQALVANAQLSTSNFQDNLNISMNYEGRIINNLLYPIYGTRPNRLIRVMTGRGEYETIQIGDPAQQAETEKAKKVASLTKDAKFNVIIKLTKNADDRRKQIASEMGELISQNPEQMQVYGDIFWRNSDSPDRQELAERAKVMLAPQIQQLLAAKEQGQEPPTPQMQALMAQNQQLQQQLQEAQPDLLKAQTEAVKIQAGGMKTQADNELKKYQIDVQAQTAITVAEIGKSVDDLKTQVSILQAEIGYQKEARLEASKQAHERDTQMHDSAHDVGMASLEHAHATAAAEQQAALQPAPQEPTA